MNMDNDNDDSCSSNSNSTAEGEEDDTQNLINTTKNNFTGMKIFSKVEPHAQHSYFKVNINDNTKFIHKQTACWVLTGEKSKVSNDRLLRVQQTNE